MKCILSFAAEGIIIDSRTKNTSVFNILESLSSPGFPLFIQRIFFFSLLSSESDTDKDAEVKLIVKNNDQTLIEIPTRVNFQNNNRSRQIIEIGGMPIPAPGILNFCLMKETDELCSYTISVRKIGDPSIKNIE